MSSATLAKMKKNPTRVTMLGAIHSGRRVTKKFHYGDGLLVYLSS